MPIGLSDFFSGFFDDLTTDEFSPFLEQTKTIKCNNCGLTFDDIIRTGKLGCGECYDTFESRIAPLMREIQGSNKHEGRIGKNKNTSSEINNKINSKKENDIEIDNLKEELKKAIKEERYEDAAKLRDKIAKKEE